jgi:hypothetical protein
MNIESIWAFDKSAAFRFLAMRRLVNLGFIFPKMDRVCKITF